MTYFECLELLDDLIADSSKGTVVFDISDITEIRRNLSDCYTADAYHKLEDDRDNLEQKYLAEKESLTELRVNHEKICSERKTLVEELDDVNDTLSDYRADLKQATSDMLAAEAKEEKRISIVDEWKNVERTVNIEHRLFVEEVVQSLISKLFEEVEKYE